MGRSYTAVTSSSRRRRTSSSRTTFGFRRPTRASRACMTSDEARPHAPNESRRIMQRGPRDVARWLERRVDDVGDRDARDPDRPSADRRARHDMPDAARCRRNESRRRDEQPRARRFGKSLIAKATDALREPDERVGRRRSRHRSRAPRSSPRCRRRKIEIECHEALSRARLEILDRVLVARVVRDDHLKARRCLDELTRSLDRAASADRR